MQENTIKGNLYVPIFGSGTCNSEFEVLAGVSTAITPPTPYVTAINAATDSLCWYYRENGFQTYAFHPYMIENWNRKYAYPLLGFQNIYDQSQMKNVKYEGVWPSDLSDYGEVISLYEQNGDDPFFMFNVTIQNHGGYDYEYTDKSVDLSKYGNFEEAENYLSLIKQSDAAFAELIEYFKKVKEPTLILCVLAVAVIIGPMITTKGMQSYFRGIWNYIYRNILLYLTYSLPGIFKGNPVS